MEHLPHSYCGKQVDRTQFEVTELTFKTPGSLLLAQPELLKISFENSLTRPQIKITGLDVKQEEIVTFKVKRTVILRSNFLIFDELSPKDTLPDRCTGSLLD
jgi:hypothetical protein